MYDPDSHSEADRRTSRPGGAATLTVAPAWREVLATNGWETLDDVFHLRNGARLSKPGLPHWRERLRAALMGPSGRKIAVYVKRFRDVPLTQQIRRCWGGDPNHGTAWTEWTWLGKLARAGIPAPEPIAYGEEMVGWWERRSAVVMAAVGGVSLERWCTAHNAPLPAKVPDVLADLVARFHALGIAHRDLYLSHIFGEALDTDAPRLSIIDLQRIVRTGRRRRRWIIKDLAALSYSTPPGAASARDRLRWLKRYLGLCRNGRYRAGSQLARRDRVLVRWIVGKTEQVRRHDARRRRRNNLR